MRNLRSGVTCGIYVLKDSFKSETFSGFCLYDEQFSIIYVNNSNAESRQIFTLFHELMYLLFRTSGVDKVSDDYISTLTSEERRIEVYCNEFAGTFLVPDEDFLASVKNKEIDDGTIGSLAKTYSVSREVILRKHLDQKRITKGFYEKKVEEWSRQARASSSGGGDYYQTQIAYLGRAYIDLALKNYYQNKIDIVQLGEYLNVKTKNISKFEDKFFSLGNDY